MNIKIMVQAEQELSITDELRLNNAIDDVGEFSYLDGIRQLIMENMKGLGLKSKKIEVAIVGESKLNLRGLTS